MCVCTVVSLVQRSFIQGVQSKEQRNTDMCVYVCVCEKERERRKEKERGGTTQCEKQPWLKQHEAFKPLRILYHAKVSKDNHEYPPPPQTRTHLPQDPEMTCFVWSTSSQTKLITPFDMWPFHLV